MSARILFVTGKGGVGKSAVATALAREAARRRMPVLLVRMPAAAGADAGAAPASPSAPLSRNRRDPGLREVVLDPQRDLEAFLRRILGFGFIARRLRDSRTFSAVAAAAPGLRDLVALTAIAAEAERRRGIVVVDAPSSGHSVPMLAAPSRVLELAPFGPVAREARRASTLLAHRRSFTAVLVTTPEELAITEVVSLRGQMHAAGVSGSEVLVNAVWPAHLDETQARAVAASHVSRDASRHWLRRARQQELIAALEREAGPCARIGYDFDRGEPGVADIEPVFDRLTGARA